MSSQDDKGQILSIPVEFHVFAREIIGLREYEVFHIWRLIGHQLNGRSAVLCRPSLFIGKETGESLI